MSSSPISVAKAADVEISCVGFLEVGEAVSHYSEAAANGFKGCRFIPIRAGDSVDTLLDDEFVCMVIGVDHRLKIGMFGERPDGLKGWIVFSNCDVDGVVSVNLGGFAGNVVNVDNYLCDHTGRPVIPEDVWSYQDYFGENDTVTINGVVYSKAWNVTRDNVPYKQQTLTAISSIQWLTAAAHTLPSGTVRNVVKSVTKSKVVVLAEPLSSIYASVGSPFMTNGSSILEAVPKPCFLHAYVNCKCGGNKHWVVGDWSMGYKSMCCGTKCTPICHAAGYVEPGDVVLTSVGAGKGVKFYKGLTLKYVGEANKVAVWRVTSTFDVDGFVSCNRFVDEYVNTFDPCSVENTTQLACALKYGMLSGEYKDCVVDAIRQGLVDISTSFLDVLDDMLPVPRFLQRLGEIGVGIWNSFKDFVRDTVKRTSQLHELCSSFASATLVVVNGTFKLLAQVPECFQAFVKELEKIIVAVLDFFVDELRVAGVAFKRFGQYVLFDNALCRLVSAKIKGTKQHGLKDATYVSIVCGPTKKVKVSRVEAMNLNLVVVNDVTPCQNGRAVVVGGQVFYTDGEHYWFMTDSDAVLETPTFGTIQPACSDTPTVDKSGGGVSFSEVDDVHEVAPVHKVYVTFEFEDDVITTVLKTAIGHKFTFEGETWDDMLVVVNTFMNAVAAQVPVPDFYVYDEEGGEDFTIPIMVSQWPLSQQNDVTSAVSEVEEVNKALDFIVEKPMSVVEKPIFDYVKYDNLVVLKQKDNNCWVNSTCLHLQMLDVLNDPAVDLFRVGRVNPLVKRCYEAAKLIVGSMGDVSECLETMLNGVNTCKITCDASCDCGDSDYVMEGCVFRFFPTPDPFERYCKTCGMNRFCTIKSIKGTGIFCQNPGPMPFVYVDPIVASVFLGSIGSGHYRTNIYQRNQAVDGFGTHALAKDHIHTIGVKDVDWQLRKPSLSLQVVEAPVKTESVQKSVAQIEQKPVDVKPVKDSVKPVQVKSSQGKFKPFCSYKNVQFYRGDFKDLVDIPHDFVVNAANENLKHGGGVAKAINDYTKGVLQDISDKYIKASGPLKRGQGVMLTCYNVRVLNVVGPRQKDCSASVCKTILYEAYSTVFSQVGVPLTPLLSVGIFGVPLETSLSVFLEVAGDSQCVCFCYSPSESKAIADYVAKLESEVVSGVNIAEANPTAQNVGSVEKPVKEKAKKSKQKKASQESESAAIKPAVVVDAKAEPVQEVGTPNTMPPPPLPVPCRVEGDVSFYDCPVQSLTTLSFERYVFFIEEDKTMCPLMGEFDARVGGALKSALANCGPLPAGNALTIRVEGDVTFVCTVLVVPSNGAKAYDKNCQRVVNKFCKYTNFVATVPPVDIFSRVLLKASAFWITKKTQRIVDAHFNKERVVVVVTRDNCNFEAVTLDPVQTFDSQLGVCTVNNVEVTYKTATAVENIVVVAPQVDWESYYGFPDAAAFETMDHSAFAYDNKLVDGVRLLKSSDNNCWVNATCIQLQYMNAKFVSNGLNAIWDDYMVGKVSKFVHWLYIVVGLNKNDKCDSEILLLRISKYLVSNTTFVVEKQTETGCCDERHLLKCPVLSASVLKSGAVDGVCKHGLNLYKKVASVEGTGVVVNVNTPQPVPKSALLDGLSYTAFVGDVSGGHYVVVDGSNVSSFDGDEVKPATLSDVGVTAVVVKSSKFVKNVKKDVKQTVNEEPAVSKLETLNAATATFATTFFTVGDFIFKNVFTVFYWLISMFSILFKSVKKRDPKVLALAPERTGVILSRSVRYNIKAFRKYLFLKVSTFKMLLKVFAIIYAMYILLFLLLRFGPLNDPICQDYVSGYANSTFVKSDYCPNIVCKICLYGYQELRDFAHLDLTWEFVTHPLLQSFMPFIYMLFLLCFGNNVIRFFMLYFILQYVNVLGTFLSLQDNIWLLQLVPFDIFCDEIVVMYCVYATLKFVYHVCFGCEKPNCIACSKSARLTRIPVQTVVNGASKTFYVNANGGYKPFCNKHNFFCLNCDSHGVGNTFINEQVARELGNVTKTSVQPTDKAFVVIDKVDFQNGFYYLYSGETFWRYNFDITEAKYSCKEVLKNCNILSDFLVFNNTGSNVTQVHNICVYLSQLLCKPIKLVDSTLLATLDVDFNGSLHAAFLDVLANSFNKDFSSCATMADCKKLLDVACSDEEFYNAVSDAHRYNVLLSDLSFNNIVTTYAKPEEKMSVHDVATCLRVGASIVNHNVLTKENVSVVWLASDFNALSEDCRKYLVKTTKQKGCNFFVTLNDTRMSLKIPMTKFTCKKGGAVSGRSFFWFVFAAIVLLYIGVGFVSFTETVQSYTGFDFKYIENGRLQDFDQPLPCVHNVFDNFASWFESKYGFVPTESIKCPIVVGVSDDVITIPGVPSGVTLVGKTLVFAIKTVFGEAGNCYDTQGLAHASSCVFASACTILGGMNGFQTYCYKEGIVEGARLYADLLPNTHYKMVDGRYIKLPEIIARGAGIRVVRTMATTYCRAGQCVDSKQGVCFGVDRFLVYNAESGSDFVCGNSLFGLFYNIFNIFSSSFSVMALSGQICFNIIVAAIAIMLCFTIVKLKRMFGDMSRGVCVVCATVIVNNVSYVVTQNYIGMVAYAVLYFLAIRGATYSWIWYVGYVVAYFTLAPWWVVAMFLVAGVYGIVPSFLKLKVTSQLFDGDKFVGTFEAAAQGTFVLDMHSYEKLVNSVAPEKLRQYAASFNRYKYYSGSANEVDYRAACFAHLAKAMMDYASNHNDQLYTPPTISYNSTLQAGLRKMAQPSGVVEKCVVRVSYGSMVLNGLWLGDQVFCPRHVVAENTTTAIDYDKAYSLIRLHNFSIAVGNVFLGVVGVQMKGTLLVIKVNQANVNTPKYNFKTLKPGDSFNILACYDGTPAGVYGVTLRTNSTIRGSFINGACGSPGYNLTSTGVDFCYMHQLELGSGCHVGSDMNGVMYGGFDDQPSLQIEGASKLYTVNVVAFLYGALLNGCNWWLTAEQVTVEAFNDWATTNDFTLLTAVDTLNILTAKTGVSVQRVLAAVQRLSKGFGGNKILGFSSLTDEFTVGEVLKQMYGVNLQSSKKCKFFGNLMVMGLFVFMFWSELLSYSTFFWVSASAITPIFVIMCGFSVLLTGCLKHKMLFLTTFLLPAVSIMAMYNLSWDLYVHSYLSKVVGYHTSLMAFDLQGVINITICCFVIGLHLYRFNSASWNSVFTLLMSLSATIYNYYYAVDYVSVVMMCLLNMSNTWYIGFAAYKLASFGAFYVPTTITMVFGHVKVVLMLYVVIGYCCCTYYGLCYWFNRTFKMSCGVYDFKVSAAEFKYMVANGLSAPRGVFDSLSLSFKLLGIGGEQTIKISTVQSALSDLKCANVVLLGCLSSMNVAANSKEWAYCVDLHNKINLCEDTERAQEMLLALLAFFISKQKDFGVDDLLDSYFCDTTLLQSVATTFVNMPSYMAYEKARQEYEDSINNGSSPSVVKQMKRAMNIAKAEFDKEASVQRKINRMAEAAATQMYKEARAVNRKSKVISSLHAMLFSMLRKLDMSSIDNILSLARDGVVPLSIIPTTCATKLSVVCGDLESFARVVFDNCVQYAGVVWNIIDIRDVDGKIVHLKEVVKDNEENISWPIYANCERMVKLQNNEIMPGKLKQRAMTAEGDGTSCNGLALYNNEGGKTFIYAFLADKPDLKVVKCETDGGCIVIELEPPCRFAVETSSGAQVKYLYFVKNLNTLRRGAVLGFIGATVRLQAGKQTELVSNSSLLTLCAFSVDPEKTYIDAVKSGTRPVGNCIKMLSNGAGNGQAITNGVEANTSQDSYGGASVCLYCRAHVVHPSMDGQCRFRGKYVQVPTGTTDPIRFCLENKPCGVCGCWLNNGCSCDRVNLQTVDQAYLNEYGALVVLD